MDENDTRMYKYGGTEGMTSIPVLPNDTVCSLSLVLLSMKGAAEMGRFKKDAVENELYCV